MRRRHHAARVVDQSIGFANRQQNLVYNRWAGIKDAARFPMELKLSRSSLPPKFVRSVRPERVAPTRFLAIAIMALTKPCNRLLRKAVWKG